MDNRVTMELATVNEKNPCGNRGFHLLCQPLALGGTRDEKWRRRGSWKQPRSTQTPNIVLQRFFFRRFKSGWCNFLSVLSTV